MDTIGIACGNKCAKGTEWQFTLKDVDNTSKQLKLTESGVVKYKMSFEDDIYGLYIYQKLDASQDGGSFSDRTIKQTVISSNPKKVSKGSFELELHHDKNGKLLSLPLKVVEWNGVGRFWGGFSCLIAVFIAQIGSCAWMAKRNS